MIPLLDVDVDDLGYSTLIDTIVYYIQLYQSILIKYKYADTRVNIKLTKE